MKKPIALLTVLLMLLAFCLPVGAAKIPDGALRGTVSDVPGELPASAQEWEVLRIVNIERMNAGVPPVTMFSAMQAATDIRALELIQSFSHTRPNGSDCFSVFAEVGINYSTAGENIAAGYQTPVDVMDGWMNSTGHRANILNSSYKHIGVGYTYSSGTQYGAYWVQLFCSSSGCAYTGFEILGDLDMSTSIDGLALAGRFTCGEGYCYMPLTSAMCTSDTTTNGVRTVTFSCFGLTASISFGGGAVPGDVDGNGTVAVADAITTLRLAMQIIDGSGVNVDAADMDGNGTVTVADAILILRIAMGLV